ncbi:hypothetical protein [Haloferax elongans]|uniref:hypothetical protein n=1 Tax=Haloferax elongans TaxID=403191 RepID=UPI0012674C1B|nr:hypothetical protein [Haloferax elongans]
MRVVERRFRHLPVVIPFQVPVSENHRAGVFPHVRRLLDGQFLYCRVVFGRFFDLDAFLWQERDAPR